MNGDGPPSGRSRDSGRGPADGIVVALIGPVFLATAVWFLFGPAPEVAPRSRPPAVSVAEIAWHLRPVMADPPTITVAGFTKKCTECHSLFTSNPETPLRLNQHRDIVQAHGMNDRCFNCHDADDRSRLMLPGGATIGFADTPRPCATCHGTTYRDWQIGIHGRTTGSWDDGQPAFARLQCTQCHDPHAPAFAPMAALPGPHTLRMGEPREHEDTEALRNPLRKWGAGRRGSTEAPRHEGGGS